MLRLTNQSAAAASKAVGDPATVSDPDGLAGAVAVSQQRSAARKLAAAGAQFRVGQLTDRGAVAAVLVE